MSPGPSPHPGAEALAGVLNRLEALHAHLDREWIAFREFRVEEFGRLRAERPADVEAFTRLVDDAREECAAVAVSLHEHVVGVAVGRDRRQPHRPVLVGHLLGGAQTTRPVGDRVFVRGIHDSGVTLPAAQYLRVGVECEIAVRLAADLAPSAAPFTQPAPTASKVFTAVINLVTGVAVISLLSGVARSAIRNGRVAGPAPAPRSR